MKLPRLPAPRADDETIVRRGLREKLVRVATKIPFAADVVALWFAARDPATPRRTKAMILAAIAYFVIPTDAIPDVFAGVGFTDDAAVIAAVLALASSAIKDRHKKAARALLARLTAGGVTPAAGAGRVARRRARAR